MKKKIITATISLFITGFCFAQSQLEMNQQAYTDYLKADAEMAKSYKKVQKVTTTTKEKKLLLDAQRAWIKFKEAHCKSAVEVYKGGSIQPLVYSTCLKQLTEERTKHLNEYLKTN